jgi:hypothetical protein
MRAWIWFLVAACGPTPRAEVDAHGGTTPDSNGTATTDGPGCTAIDVLFVVDNSGSMAEEQQNLIANFPQFIAVLDQSGLDYRVGVTTTGRNYDYTMQTPIGPIPQHVSGGDNGALLHPTACAMSHPWIEKADPHPAQTFSCVANVGTNGPGEEMPLGAVHDAFGARMTDGTNAGFHRPDALLAVVILTDENDCSYEQPVTMPFGSVICQSQMEPVATYKTFLDTYAGGPSRWAAAVIAGKGPGNCSSSFGSAEEATRLEDLVQQVGANAVMASICDGDLSIGLMQAVNLFGSACNAIIL